ncbi:MAG: signal recognition particle-docking protein FtsY [Candidatus Anaerobiospirillum merdipullorum]|uniref:Signal recognition particle receptor FtsY n=1 Tax=Candidatus Anaerobiospirillum merdipullorum TaxID=2838450 RepID=A0A9E2NS11_9GAMM|nr:signal recognition particle-docking protein FtsY [Candidatus Anaerobiospirillum merdipullorum]
MAGFFSFFSRKKKTAQETNSQQTKPSAVEESTLQPQALENTAQDLTATSVISEATVTQDAQALLEAQEQATITPADTTTTVTPPQEQDLSVEEVAAATTASATATAINAEVKPKEQAPNDAPAAQVKLDLPQAQDKTELKTETETCAATAETAQKIVQEEEPVPVSASASEALEEESVKVERESFFSRLRKTRENLASGFSALLKGRIIDEDLYEELETSLLTADLGIETTTVVIEKLREEAKLRELHDASLLRKRLQQVLTDLLKPCEIPLDVTTHKPFVILMVGVNGAGKTTTIGKLARKYKDQGLKVMLAAGDTFRAAAVEQLKEWGRRVDAPVIAQATGSDSASVLFDALNAAKARGMDVLICDTAGRLQNKSGLMEELKKIVRVLKKIDPEVPHEVLLVLDASTGQNAVSQTKIFKEASEVSGICLTKLDGTAKGGVIFALADKFKLPLRYVGLGEKAEDLRPFKADLFVQALLKQD